MRQRLLRHITPFRLLIAGLVAAMGLVVIGFLALMDWASHRPPDPTSSGKDFLGSFIIPDGDTDLYGNPVRKGTDPATGYPLEIREKSTAMYFVFIPPGEFLMGSPNDEKDRGDDEGPVHRVRITKPFYMGKYEVTQGRWCAVMGTKPWTFRKWWFFERDQEYAVSMLQHAAAYLSWDDCQEFIKKLNDAVRSKALQRLETGERGAEAPH
jgi:formylglycine-generating enzyme required for sulfatase activity